MFRNNIKVALRNLRKNKVYAAINILGLAIGLAIFVLGRIIVQYEETHDAFFENSSRIYTVGSIAAEGLDVGVDRFGSTFSAVGPIIEAELSDVEAVARTLSREMLMSAEQDRFYQVMLFADPALSTIFDFEYLHGDETALEDPTGLLLTEETAVKYFGHTDVLGEVVTIDNQYDFHVTAVIEEVPANSHFNSSIALDARLGVVVPIGGLARMRNWDVAGNWNSLSLGNMTYVLLGQGFDQAWLASQMDSLYDRLVPIDTRDRISALTVAPLARANLMLWDMMGLPIFTVIGLLALMVLTIACVNYTNLAIAQSLGRTREVGMRKTMGATQTQLLTQFIVESLVITTIAMLLAISFVELIIPLLNNVSNKAISLNYLSMLPWLILTTVAVGVAAGLYPAWLITRVTPIDALRDIARKGRKGATMRSVMIGVQFAISAFMLALVSIVYFQNDRVDAASYEFPRSEIYSFAGLDNEAIRPRMTTLKHEIESIPNVDIVSFSSQVPYEQNNSQSEFALEPGNEAGAFYLQHLRMTPDFLETFDIPILAGRNLSQDIANDEQIEGSETLNVLVNELALSFLGAGSPEEALGMRIHSLSEGDPIREHIVVGVVPTQNIIGLFNEPKPWIFYNEPANLRLGSVRISGGEMMQTVEQIEDAWDRVIPEFPLRGRFLDEIFNDIYNILKLLNVALAIFASIALSLALIGLFGLAAFMAAQRTREIGVRKVLGASTSQIARLLVWQFSKPVMWALFIALPGAYFASEAYLNFFADRINMQIPILIVSGLLAVILAWTTIAGHAIRIARANPILALRYE